VAFGGITSAASGGGIYLRAGASLATLVDSNTAIPNGSGEFEFFDDISFDGSSAAFIGFDAQGDMGIYRTGGLRSIADLNTAIPDGAGNFILFRSGDGVAIDGGTVAFHGHGASNQAGIYAEINGVLDKVVDIGDSIDGKTPTSFEFGPRSLSGHSLAVLVHFSNNTSGYYRIDITPPLLLTADFDDDLDVDGQDLALWRTAFKTSAVGDADGDGDSDGKDFLAWQQQLGNDASELATSAVVPEPATTTLFAIALAACGCTGGRPTRAVRWTRARPRLPGSTDRGQRAYRPNQTHCANRSNPGR
jgi:hypothetical protein